MGLWEESVPEERCDHCCSERQSGWLLMLLVVVELDDDDRSNEVDDDDDTLLSATSLDRNVAPLSSKKSPPSCTILKQPPLKSFCKSVGKYTL